MYYIGLVILGCNQVVAKWLCIILAGAYEPPEREGAVN